MWFQFPRLGWSRSGRPPRSYGISSRRMKIRRRPAPVTMLRRLQERKISVLLCGMVAPPNLGAEYGRAFNSIFPDLAAQNGAILYPFFLTGVAADPKLNQRDGLHPTAAGVAVIVDRILLQVEELIARAKGSRLH